jgi:hypothetical protein
VALTHSQLRAVNRPFGPALGFNALGGPNFKWGRTEELFYYVEREGGFALRGALYIPTPDHWERRCWADRLGRCWVLWMFEWKTEDQWNKEIGLAMPWPSQGMYRPVFNVTLDRDPTLDDTARAIAAANAWRDRVGRADKDASDRVAFAEMLAEDEREEAAYMKSKKSELDSMLDDAMTAYGKIPGTHGESTEFQSGGPRLLAEPKSSEPKEPLVQLYGN